MRVSVGWGWPLLAALAALVALAASANRPVSASAAAVAVVAASLAIVGVLTRARVEAPEVVASAVEHPGGLREAFVGGELGRVDLVLACDLLERRLARPNLRARTPAEVEALVRLPPEQFRRYLASRLDELEASS